jgi:transposase
VSGQIGISLPSGVRLTVDAGVDADALARVLAVLGR